MAGSSTPPNRGYFWTRRNVPTSAMAMADDDHHHHSLEDESFVKTPTKTTSQPRLIPRSVCLS